ncbi:MAG: hypothetical protein IKM38_10160, partial [Christensenellaceae bacterium]|nr:hypothetical protein [Christensenellaceae bacterium]
MKRFTALLMALMLVFALVGCTKTEEKPSESAAEPTEAASEEVAVMTYEEYAAAELDSEVVIEAYVQA